MKKTFEFEGKTYIIVKERCGSDDTYDYQVKVTDVTKEREIFAWRPWWIGKKFRWLKTITVKERLEFVRYSDFDDGWTYKNFWKPWQMNWDVIEILS
jgi:hypothetical protein